MKHNLKLFSLVFVVAVALSSCGGGVSETQITSGNDNTGTAISLAQTGQKLCYTPAGNTISCVGTGQDGEKRAGVSWPIPRFTANTDTTVMDKLTGLIWAGDAGTPTFSWLSTCTGGSKTWQAALDYVACLNTNSYLGYNDWRLPNANELKSLMHAGCLQESCGTSLCTTNADWLNTQSFSHVQPEQYWSSTTRVDSTVSAWYVNMRDGFIFFSDKTANLYVWPVRSGQTAAANLPQTGQTTCYNQVGGEIICTGTGQDGEKQAGVSWPSQRFTDNYDGTLTDNLTGLSWTSAGNAPTVGLCNGGSMIWQNALTYVDCLNRNNYLGYNDWRMPNSNEMRSLVNYGRGNIQVWLSGQGFHYVQNSYYWSSTTYNAGNGNLLTGNAWAINMLQGGHAAMASKEGNSGFYVLPVRGGQ